MDRDTYILITPVRDEEATIGVTLESVVRQTVRPSEWVVVSDGSTDRTDEIVRGYATKYPFIRLLRLGERSGRSFSSVVHATQSGLASLDSRHHDYVGLLDADVRFGETYYQELIERFRRDARLGLAGGLVVDCIDGRRVRVGQTLSEVAGAVQFFRRRCFDEIGGLTAIPEGGWDAITCVQVRMLGYRTRTFADLEVDHLKPRNISEGGVPRRFFYLGVRDYALGNHEVFEALKCAYRCFEPPFLIGGGARFAGYAWSWVTRRRRVLPKPLMEYIRHEQLSRLWPFVARADSLAD